MRKLLLAGAAMLGASAGIASAQAPMPSNPIQGQMAMPNFPQGNANSLNNFVGQPSTYVGSKSGLVVNPPPAPGTVIVRLGGRIEVDFMASTQANFPGVAATAATVAGGVVTRGATAAVAPAKFNPISFASYLRLYPGVDGMATNGLRYGAQAELREAFQSSASVPYPSNNPAASPSGSTSAQAMYVRRAFIYISADNVGMFRFGQGDGLIGLFDPCIFSSGCFDAGLGLFQAGLGSAGTTGNLGNSGDYFALAQNGAEYGNTKFVYMSPQIFGLDVGVQYAPNMENSNAGCSAQTANLVPQGAINAAGSAILPNAGGSFAAAGAATGCTNTTSGIDGSRWYNQVGLGARWQGDFGTFHAGAYVVWQHAAAENNYTAGVAANPSFITPGSPPTTVTVGGRPISGAALQGASTAGWNGKFAPLNFINAAYYVRQETSIGTFTQAMTFSTGQVNSALALKPQGGANLVGFQPNLTWSNGPWIAGVAGFFVTEQGANNLTGISQRREMGLAGAVAYNIAPGLYTALEYQYETKHQFGFNFITNANGADHNDTHASALIFVLAMNW